MQTLQRLVYCSRNRIVRTPEAMSAGLEAILAASRRNNARLGITGVLLFNAGCFGQVLEGTRAAVEHLFERIQQDERHGEGTLLGFSEPTGRTFSHWSMAFVGAAAAEAARYADIARRTGFDPELMVSEQLLRVLVQLTIDKERAD